MIDGPLWSGTVFALLLALLIDRLLGEPTRYHPLVGFGRLATGIEKRFNRASEPMQLRLAGLLACLLALALVALPVALLYHISAGWPLLQQALAVVLLYWALGAKSLEQHAQRVRRALLADDLPAARAAVARIVSRDCSQLDEEGVARATVESVLENGSDALFAPLFWFVVAGPLAVLGYRLANTLDAMWGYRNERYRYFGWASARLDDLLNWLPARCCAASYALCGRWQQALQCWRTQAALCDSPNAGPVMSSGAGALGLRLGGPASYQGVQHWRPALGAGDAADAASIGRAIQLLRRATLCWLLVIATLALVLGVLR